MKKIKDQFLYLGFRIQKSIFKLLIKEASEASAPSEDENDDAVSSTSSPTLPPMKIFDSPSTEDDECVLSVFLRKINL